MIIVPELQKVFILVPRTGSGTLYREMQRVYPKAMLLYRHAEADLCPRGYDRWERIGFVRHPLHRLWSLWNFMLTFQGGAITKNMVGARSDNERARKQTADRTFEDWLLNNQEPWTMPFDVAHGVGYWPSNTRSHACAETRLSQNLYLRPDLGVHVRKFEDLAGCLAEWGLDSGRVENQRKVGPTPPPTSAAVQAHLERFCAWDLEQNCKPI